MGDRTQGERRADPVEDWTVDPATGRSNSSAEFVALADEVGRLIRDSAFEIVRGHTGGVGRLILAQLAHKHGLALRHEGLLGAGLSEEDLDEIDWYRRCLEDVQDGRPVRGLTEAKLGYDSAMDRLRSLSGRQGGDG